jgi:hypothetical protein
MDLTKLDSLKELLVKAPVIADVFTYFLDHFGEREEFHDLGGRVENELLQTILIGIAGKMFGPAGVLADCLFVRLPEYHFIHGGFVMNGHPATVLYFDDIEVGIVVVAAVRRGEETRFSRFSGRKLPPEYWGSDN